MTSAIIGTGSAMPERIVTNDDLAKIVETSDAWISDRTGIRARRIAIDETVETLSIAAAKQALEDSGIDAADLQLILVATLTPEGSMPNTACKVQTAIGATNAMCFDINAACSGFMHGLQTAHAFISAGLMKHVLVIGAETLSRITDWTDRNTCVLFGDGAGAAIYKAAECEGKNTDTGILATKIYADGSQYDKLCSDSGVSFNQKSGFIHMDGKEVFKVAVPSLVQGVEETLAIANVDINDVDWYIPHQANLRIIDSVAKKLELDESKVIVTVDHHGNTSAASIPLALAESIESGKVKKGDLVAFSSMGAGFTWGGMVIRI